MMKIFKIKISGFYVLILGLLLINPSCQPKHQDGSKPNLVLIVADDLGWRDLHCYGNQLVATPHLDQMAADGIMFTNAYASASICSPTRASLLTGKNPVAVDITDYIPGKQFEKQQRGIEITDKLLAPEFNHQLTLEEITLAEILQQEGYNTASIGKWHLGGEGYLPTDQGFDINMAGNHMGLPPSYYFPYTADHFDFEITHLPLTEDSLYLTDRLGNEAVRFIEENRNHPFFLYLPFYTVHTPWEGKPDLVAKYQKLVAVTDDTIQRDPQFLAMIESLDQNVGKVMQALQHNQLEGNTLIIFVSDNGGLNVEKGNKVFGSYNYPLRGGKATLYEGGLRVPILVQWPGKIPVGQVSRELIISTDILPTVLHAFGINSEVKTEGVSLWQHLTNKQPVARETFYWHYPHYHRSKPGSVIREGDYKLIHYYEDNRSELYDLNNDIGEKFDLVKEFPAKAKELEGKLGQWLKDNNAKFARPNPNY
ncbi:MAG: sulfatase [Candidatus Cyclobacteriaceae bacterium M3_2C_046]